MDTGTRLKAKAQEYRERAGQAAQMEEQGRVLKLKLLGAAEAIEAELAELGLLPDVGALGAAIADGAQAQTAANRATRRAVTKKGRKK